MSSFKEFFYLNEAKTPKPPAPGRGARFTNTGLQIGKGADFPQMGVGYQPISGPQSITQWLKDYESGGLEQDKTETNILVRASRTFQAIYTAINSGDEDEVTEVHKIYGQHVKTEGQVGQNGWIRNLMQSDGKGNGIMHRGIAKGFQLSGPEVEYLKKLQILVPAREQHMIPDDICLDFNGDLLYQMLEKRKTLQGIRFGAGQVYDDILGRMVAQGRMTNIGTNLEPGI